MDEELKKRWLEALRSGRYRQGLHQLREDDAFCCLGVLCDIVDPDGWTYLGASGFKHREGVTMPSLQVLGRLGLGRVDDLPATLAGMNDRGRSFGEIADFIEQNL